MNRTNVSQSLLVLLLTLGCIRLQAQVEVGLKGGANYVNNVVVTDLFDNGSDYRVGYHAGVFASIPLSERFSLSPELLFSDKGFKILEDVTDPNSDYSNLKLSYLNVPVLLGYNVFDKLTIQAGPELGDLLSASTKFDGESIDVGNIWNNEFDFGLAFGLTYAITEKVSVGGRYTHGFSSVAGDIQFTNTLGVTIEGEDFEFQNRTFQLSIAYSLFSI